MDGNREWNNGFNNKYAENVGMQRTLSDMRNIGYLTKDDQTLYLYEYKGVTDGTFYYFVRPTDVLKKDIVIEIDNK